jgi:cobalt-zinc-cadmium efflux system protein
MTKHYLDNSQANYNRAFAIGIVLNLGFVIVEGFYGWKVSSLALLADAGHNLSDVAGLILAWVAMAISRLQPNDRHTYGWRKGSIMASFINAAILMIAMGSLGWEAIHRLQIQSPVDGITMMVVAAIGVVINSATAVLFMSGSKGDLNIRGAFLHMAADALISLGVVLAGALYLWQGWSWIDPVLSLLIAMVIIIGTWRLFKQSLHLLFDGVPEHVDVEAVRQYLLQLSGVRGIHDLHIWAMSTTETALTVHFEMETSPLDDNFMQNISNELLMQFGISHATIQLEYGITCGSAQVKVV